MSELPPLHSAAAENFTNPSLYPIPTEQEWVVLLDAIRANQAGFAAENKLSHPLIPAEQTAVLGLLRYVDYCLWTQRQYGHAKPGQARLGRLVSYSILETLPKSEIELDDLRQEARLRVVTALRSNKETYNSRFLTYLGISLIAVQRHVGSIGLLNGFAGNKGGLKHGETATPADHLVLSRALRSVFGAPIELGFSDELANLYDYPNFFHLEPLKYTIPAEESDEKHLAYDQRTAEPEDQSIDGYTPQLIHELETTNDLDRVFGLLEGHGPKLNIREKMVLEYIFVKGMTTYEIAGLEGFNCTHQNISQIYHKALNKIRITAKAAQLKDLMD